MGQLVPFPAPAPGSACRQLSRLSARTGRLIPLIPPSRLFVAGMAAQYPVIRKMADRLGTICDPLRPARERIIEKLIATMPPLPAAADVATVERLLDSPVSGLCETARAQIGRSPEDRRMYALGQSVWRDIESPLLREFAQKCAVALTETFYLARQEAKNASAA